jgi:hypothetical protein
VDALEAHELTLAVFPNKQDLIRSELLPLFGAAYWGPKHKAV